MSSPRRIVDFRGRVIGFVTEQDGQIVYQLPSGRVVARYVRSGDYTLNENGTRVGFGNLGMMLLNDD